MSTDLIYIIYVSAAIRSFSDEELIELLTTSRQNNEARQITGMLLYCDGQFIQVIEGPRGDVQQLFEQIKVDSRYSSVLKLYEKPIEHRCFAQWSMGFRSYSIEEVNHIKGYQSFKEAIESKGEGLAQHTHVVFRLLETFAHTMCKWR